jgi:hypothetical protein
MQTQTNNKRWAALGVIALAQFMVIMDTSIIGVALPEITGRCCFRDGREHRMSARPDARNS